MGRSPEIRLDNPTLAIINEQPYNKDVQAFLARSQGNNQGGQEVAPGDGEAADHVIFSQPIREDPR